MHNRSVTEAIYIQKDAMPILSPTLSGIHLENWNGLIYKEETSNTLTSGWTLKKQIEDNSYTDG